MVDIPEPTPAERKLIAAAAKGEIADFRTGDKDRDDPANAAAWGPDRTLRAEILCLLATRTVPDWPLHWHGIQIDGARITGSIDLEGARLDTRLILRQCFFDAVVRLQDSEIDFLSLQGSRLPGLNADGVVVKGGVFLHDGFHAIGEVRLLDADIGGTLDCTKGSFRNAEGKALSTDRATVKGGVFLDDGFHAMGEVWLPSMDIGGNLACRNGRFEKPKGTALAADGATVKGTVFLDDGFHAMGEVRLLRADIGGNLTCTKGRFENAEGNALAADGATVTGSVFLIDGFHATGEVRLSGVSIGNDLACRNGKFEKVIGHQFDLERAKIAGGLQWTKVTLVGTGHVNFHLASVGALNDDAASWPLKGRLILDGFTYGTIGGHAPTDWRARKDWLDRQWHPDGRFRPQPYEQLIKVLRAMGHDRDARQIAMEKQRALRRSGGLKLHERLWNCFMGVTLGYGYQPWRAVVVLFMFLVLGGIGAYCAAERGIMVPAKERVYMAATYPPAPSDYPVLDPMIYSLDVLLPIVDLHQESYWLPSVNKPYGALARWYMWLHIAVGWIFTTLAVAGFTGLVKKD